VLRVSIAQISPEGTKDENADKVEALIRRARGADVIVFPEYSLGAKLEHVDSLAEPVNGPLIRRIATAAQEYGLTVIMGILESAEGGPYNSVVLMANGDAIVVHRKVLLFDALGSIESRYVRPGDMPLTLVRLGEFTVGFATCFELRFPEIFRSLATAGADLFIVPAAWYAGNLKEEQWLVSAASRAMENVAYLVAADSAARAFVGRSLVVNPWGHVELDLGKGERLVTWEISRDVVDEARTALPLVEIANRRVGTWTRVRRIN
jgi:predicted amidohydrolase